MKFLLIYGTMKGQTAKIAEYIAQALRTRGDEVDAVDGRTIPPDFVLAPYDGVIVGASVNAGRFQSYIVDFVRTHREEIRRVPSAFFSVSLTEADPDPTKHARALNPIARLSEKTGWQPDMIASFAGSIAYLRYRWLMHLIWPRLALPDRRGDTRSGGLNDHDYEYTDWDAVSRFADAFATAAHARRPETAPVARAS
jgi:menaquinone-dependent protoporphyrinogen oxidase